MLTHGSCGRTERIRVRSACRLHVRDLFAKGENGVAVATAPIHGLSFLNVCRAQRSITLDTQATRGDARCALPSELNPRVTGSHRNRAGCGPRRAAPLGAQVTCPTARQSERRGRRRCRMLDRPRSNYRSRPRRPCRSPRSVCLLPRSGSARVTRSISRRRRIRCRCIASVFRWRSWTTRCVTTMTSDGKIASLVPGRSSRRKCVVCYCIASEVSQRFLRDNELNLLEIQICIAGWRRKWLVERDSLEEGQTHEP